MKFAVELDQKRPIVPCMFTFGSTKIPNAMALRQNRNQCTHTPIGGRMESKFQGSYEQLHGIPQLHEAIDIAKSENPNFDVTTKFCMRLIPDLCLLHVVDQVNFAIRSSASGDLNGSLKALRWSNRFLSLGIISARRFCQLNSSQTINLTDSSSSIERLYLSTLVGLDSVFLDRASIDCFTESELSNELRRHYYYKSLLLPLRRICTRLLAVREEGSYQEKLLSSIYDLAAPRAAAFNPFRGLHQIPELLAYGMNSDIELAMNEPSDNTVFVRLQEVNAGWPIIIESAFSLINEIDANSYHLVRQYLGTTSGSHSVEIAKRLIRTKAENLKSLSHRYSDVNPLGSAIRTECGSFIESCIFWRDLHFGMPNLVLGSGGTRSLIGSNDAMDAVAGMRSAFIRSVVGSDYFGTARDPRTAPRTRGEEEAVSLLGNKTQARFEDVQNRTGFYKKDEARDV